MLTFIGLGLYDERSITVEGRDAIADTDRVFAEFYTSKLIGADVTDLEAFHDTDIEVRDRAGVEQHPDDILAAAESGDAAFLTAGDTMISTTHVDLRLRAEDRGIDTRVVHAPTAESAASGLTGLQNYRFGKATTLPFEYAHGADGLPASVTDVLDDNRERGLHTLVYLDIKVGWNPRKKDEAGEDEYMTASHAAELLADGYDDVLAVVVARAGSPDPLVEADRLSELAERDFGDPLHLLVVPGDLHHIEADALESLADAPSDLLDVV
ncbi:diphthine synthase [Haladaptatus sp. W1]|uniref:diphthine synthase n=1 Tax=Haladaptatus sp. W1 TaxID=1897478 RepID=UPI000849D71D|nr:diphthine synthase [Haladaptatus sp. W1]ODR82804.1 diphthine synthase [Haladaptatus sp. W1]